MNASTPAVYPEKPDPSPPPNTGAVGGACTEIPKHRNTGLQVAPNAFFSPIPRAVWDLRGQGALKPRDIDVLGLLLDYKNIDTAYVNPRQDTLARRLACSVDTIQRSLTRLAAAGLIVKSRLRSAAGRLGRCVYDLAPTLARLPHRAARMRSGRWGRGPAPTAPDSCSLPRPHRCGLREEDSFAQADNSAPAPTSPPPSAFPASPVAGQMIALGVAARAAVRLLAGHGEARCRQALAAAQERRNVHNRPAWLVKCLTEHWTLTERWILAGPRQSEDSARPRSHHPYTPPSIPAAPPPDPLTQLPPARWSALEERARLALRAEKQPAVLEMLRTGRARRLIAARMRALLAAPV